MAISIVSTRGGVGSLSTGGAPVTALVATEHAGGRTIDLETRQQSTRIDCVVTIATLPQNVTYWKSPDNGLTFVGIGWEPITTVGQVWSCVGIVPELAQQWKMAACAGIHATVPVATPAASLPAGTIVSATINIPGVSKPSASTISALIIAAGTSGDPNHPYNAVRPDDGSQYWSIPSVSYDDTLAVQDQASFFVRVTVQAIGAAHGAADYVGPEVPYGGTYPSTTGMVQRFPHLDGDYGNHGNGVTYTGNIAYVRFRVYSCNRIDPTNDSFSNAAAATLQTGIGGGAGYLDVLVAGTGTLPTGKGLLTRADPASYDSSVFGVNASGQFAQLAVDLSLPKAGTYDANVFKPVGNIFKLNYDTTNFDSGAGGLVIKQIDAGTVKTGNLLVGTSISGIASGITVYKNVSGVNTVVGWLGSNGAVVGGWVKEFYIGGTGPGDAPIYCNSAGVAHFRSAIVVGDISGLGALATLSSVTTAQVTGLGTLATQNTVAASTQVTGLGTLATQSSVTVAQVSGLGPFATATVISGNSITTGKIDCNLVNISGTLTAALVSLNLNNITTTITNAYDSVLGQYVGLRIQSNSSPTSMFRALAGFAYIGSSDGSLITLNPAGSIILQGSGFGTGAGTVNISNAGQVNTGVFTTGTGYGVPAAAAGFYCGGTRVIDTDGNWVGSGYVSIKTKMYFADYAFGGSMTATDHLNAGTSGPSTGVIYVYDASGNYKGKVPYYG